MPRQLDPELKALYEKFTEGNCQFETVTRWRNTLKSKKYEKQCLLDLVRYCLKFNTTPDELIKQRIQQMKNDAN